MTPADDDLVYALTNIARELKYGPDQAWIEEAIETTASLSSELARCRNALEEARARFVDIANAAPLGPQDAISTWRALAEARFSVAFCALATIDAALNPIGEKSNEADS